MRDPSLEEVLESNFSYQMAGVNTAIPGIVVAIRDDLTTSYVDVQPSLNLISEDDDPIPRPVCLNIPLVFPVSNVGGITFGVNVGDTVLLVYSMRGLDTWKRGDGSSATPTDYRKLDSRDAIAIPGLPTLGQGINNPSRRSNVHSTSDTTIFAGLGTPNETEVRLTQGGGVTINAPSSATINTEYAEINSPLSKFNGDVVISGTLRVEDLITYLNGIAGTQGTNTNSITGGWNISGGTLTHNGVSIGSDHRHSGIDAGPDTSGPPV